MPSVACLVVVELKVRLVSLICSLLLVDAVTALICCQSRVDLSKYQYNKITLNLKYPPKVYITATAIQYK